MFCNTNYISDGTYSNAVVTMDTLARYATLSNVHFTNTIIIPGAMLTNTITFPAGLSLGGDIMAAGLVLHPSTCRSSK